MAQRQSSSGRRGSEPTGQARGNKPETRPQAKRETATGRKRSGSMTSPAKAGRQSTKTGRD